MYNQNAITTKWKQNTALEQKKKHSTSCLTITDKYEIIVLNQKQ